MSWRERKEREKAAKAAAEEAAGKESPEKTKNVEDEGVDENAKPSASKPAGKWDNLAPAEPGKSVTFPSYNKIDHKKDWHPFHY